MGYRIVAPKQLGDDVAAVAADIQAYLRDDMATKVRDAAENRRGFLGAKVSRAVNPFSVPTTPRPVGNLNPHLAGGGDAKAMRLAVPALKTFRLAYREAWLLFKKGLHAVFPGGTLPMHKWPDRVAA